MIDKQPYRNWEYARVGDYHRNLDPNWEYTPTYLRKVALVKQFIELQPPKATILDVGCGEGVFVEEFSKKGWNIQGLDLNYESELVQRGDARNIPYSDKSLDSVIFLDALEHLAFEDQPQALSEIYRVLKPDGKLFISVPNLAHLNSRIRFLVTGKLDRTDLETEHIGERPMWENQQLLKESNFEILDCTGVTFTMPFIYRKIICRHAAKFRWLHDAMEPLSRLFPSLAMLNFFICKKRNKSSVYGN